MDDDDLALFVSPAEKRRRTFSVSLPSALASAAPKASAVGSPPPTTAVSATPALSERRASTSMLLGSGLLPPLSPLKSEDSQLDRTHPDSSPSPMVAETTTASAAAAWPVAPLSPFSSSCAAVIASGAAASHGGTSATTSPARPASHMTTVPPEASYLTGGLGGPPEFQYYAPPLKWRRNGNPRERRVEDQPVAPPVSIVGMSPVVWTDEAERERKGRRQVFEDRSKAMSSLSVLDATIVAVAGSPSASLETSGGGEGQSLVQQPFSVRGFYVQSHITPFRRVHVHQEGDIGRSPAEALETNVDSRRVWGPREERSYTGVYRSWWQ